MSKHFDTYYYDSDSEDEEADELYRQECMKNYPLTWEIDKPDEYYECNEHLKPVNWTPQYRRVRAPSVPRNKRRPVVGSTKSAKSTKSTKSTK